MTLTIYPSQAYALLTGLFIGKFTNLFSDVVITGLVLYIVTPEIFTEERLERGKDYFWSWFETKAVTIEMSDLASLSTEQKLKLLEGKKITNPFLSMVELPEIEVIQSPKSNKTN